jgi:hypothetical protein
VLFTHDADLLAEATRRQRERVPFAGVIYAQQLEVTLGQCVRDLALIAGAADSEELAGRVQFLPLR